MKKILLCAVGIFYCVVFAQAQHTDRSRFIKDSLDFYINRSLTNWRIPGAAVCIIKDGKVVLMKAYGIKELGQPAKVDENSLFMIGSNTKAFTATALAMLQSQNKLSLDDKVTKYLPQFKIEGKPADDVLIRDLLCHRLGFETFQGDFTFYNTNLSRAEIIKRLGMLKRQYPFRTKWGYTNAAFLTAGEIIPVAYGKPWEVFLKENIFAPLGMSNTLALSADMPKSLNRTVPHTLIDGRLSPIPYAQLDGMAPCGAICSSINDMSKWVLALLNDGKVGPRQVIPAAAIQATRQPQDIVGSITHLNGETNYELYGLGWFLQDYSGHRLVMHDGGVNGYLSSVTLVPQDKLGIVILTNTDQNEFFEALRWEIMDAYFKLPYRDYTDAYLTKFKNNAATDQAADKKLRDSVAMNLKPALSPSSYTGKYVNDLYGSMVVTQGENNDLEMRFEHHPKMYVHLQPLGGNRFYATFSDPTLGKAVFPFQVQNGSVKGVRIKVADFVERGAYEFAKQ
ncbi:serine hydrolase [Mucilaginibacter sp. L3T2-6]|uniref:serine hydrolase n=1 Tax=Mucilaginibacter sp. L3T2-6 TaxID=3062491 RepID=UPI0026748E68|nr:serine hydrolase [Mucilaginibacter sp. L3T2-6]MDO3643184.1 serine hydrolase [Mucilaginibacter sp. L3T2-6]MDV6215508.1 serine hydrolase [Mucilaginibacter sp. L3T2-6]